MDEPIITIKVLGVPGLFIIALILVLAVYGAIDILSGI